MNAVAPVCDDYIGIIRYVRPLADSNALDRNVRSLLRSRRSKDGTTLESLLNSDTLEPIVLVAPSGSGKTTELRQLTCRLRSSGRPAFFADACSVLATSEMDLDREEREAFATLLASSSSGIVVVDALDELRLRQNSFEQLFRRLAREIDLDAHPCRLIFSARNGAWTSSATRELQRLVARLGVNGLQLVTFEPLDMPAIKQLAGASRVADVEAFGLEFEEEELGDLLELRPADVKLLAHMRATSGRLTKWTELLQQYVDASFIDERSERTRTQRLSIEVGRRGVQRIAAAAMLMRNQHVSTSSVAVSDGVISSRRLFADWSAMHLTELFENPLFVHKGRDAEAVQLPQGPLSFFLAARWFAERTQNGLPVETLQNATLVRMTETQRFEIPEAHQKVVGWLASEVPEFRKLIVAQHPEVVLYEGDPDRLSDIELREAMQLLCEAIAAGKWDGWATPATLRRVARPGLEADVRALLERYKDSPKVVQQLLKFVEHGRYRTCSEQTLRLADESADSLVRFLAIGAFAAAAPDERTSLIRHTADADAYVRLALLRALVPDFLQGKAFVTFVLQGGGHPIREGLREVAHRVATEDLDALLSALAPILSSSVVSTTTREAFETAVPALLARLERAGTFHSNVVELLSSVERLRYDHVSMNLVEMEEQSFTRLLERSDELRRRLWSQRLQSAATSANALHHVMHPLFGDVQAQDVEWLWTMARKRESGTRNEALFLLERLWSRLSEVEREELLGSPVAPELRAHLLSLRDAESELAEKRRAHEEEEHQKDEQTRRENEEALTKRRAEIESGDDIDALMWGWKHLEGPGSENARISPARLRRYVGEEYVEVFLRGLRACWRKIDVPVPQPAEGKMYRYLLGLTGVTLAAREGLDLSSLSPEEAKRAARFGLYELNAFPFWYSDLARAHADEVRLALCQALALEWAHATELHGVLRFATGADRDVCAIMRSLVLDLVDAGPPAHATTLDYAVDAILTATTEVARVTSVVGSPGTELEFAL